MQTNSIFQNPLYKPLSLCYTGAMEKKISSYMSVSKRVLLVRCLCICLILLCVAAIVLSAVPLGKAECSAELKKSFSYSVGTVETQSYSRISFEFSREIERADVVVRLVTPGGAEVETISYRLSRGWRFVEDLPRTFYSDEISDVEVASVNYTLARQNDIALSVGVLAAVLIVYLAIVALRTRCKEFVLDEHKVEIYCGNIRHYINVDEKTAVSMPYALKSHARLQAVAGGNLVIADISFWQKITVSLQKLEEFGHVSGEEVNGGSFPEQIRSPQPDKVPEIKRVKAYLITGAALIALGAAGCIALCCTHYYVFGALVFLVGMAVAPVFFRHNCKVYEVDGHTVVLFTGPVKKYISVDGEIQDSYFTNTWREVFLHAQASEKSLTATFSGFRYMDLKVSDAEK